jgi:CRISPR-associated protein Cmr1
MERELMKKLIYKVQFVTPAFLGNAEHSGQWRTPPFKALYIMYWEGN